MVWAGWLYSQEWGEPLKRNAPCGTTLERSADVSPNSSSTADANDVIPGAHVAAARRRHDAGVQRRRRACARSIKVPLLYMPSETDLYFR